MKTSIISETSQEVQPKENLNNIIYLALSSDTLIILNDDKSIQSTLLNGTDTSAYLLRVDLPKGENAMYDMIDACYEARKTGVPVKIILAGGTVIFQ